MKCGMGLGLVGCVKKELGQTRFSSQVVRSGFTKNVAQSLSRSTIQVSNAANKAFGENG